MKIIILFSLLFSFKLYAIDDDLCMKAVRFEGMCEMYITSFEWDGKEGKCIKREGSGCSSHNGFKSQAECEETCGGKNSLFERISKKTQEKLGN